MLAKNDGSINYGVSELQHDNKYPKDKCLESNHAWSETAIKIVFAGEIIEKVKEFCYLGNMISNDATEKSREG